MRAPVIDRPASFGEPAGTVERSADRHLFVEGAARRRPGRQPHAVRDLQTADVLPPGARFPFLRNGPVLGPAREGEHLVLFD